MRNFLLLIFLILLFLFRYNVLDYTLSDEVVLDHFVLKLLSDYLDRLVLVKDISDLETGDLFFANDVEDLFDVLRAVQELRYNCPCLGT